MANKLSEFRQWLLSRRRFRVAWFAKDPQLTPASEEALSQLPDEVADKLIAAANELPVHPREKEKTIEALDEAISQWRNNPHLANNSIVFLAHPVASVSRVLSESLHELRSNKDEPLPINLLDWIERPPKPVEIKQRIQDKLDWSDEEPPPVALPSQDRIAEDNPEHQSDNQGSHQAGPDGGPKAKGIAVIPNLCWCFLRSADGLEGIDYLQDTLLSDRAQFWVIGSGQVGWEYLKSSLKIHAYCGNTVPFPRLTAEQLQDWLKPLFTTFDIRVSDTALHKRLQNPSNLLSLRISPDKPLEAISEVTQEVSATVQSSIRALRSEVVDEDDDIDASPKRDYFKRLADISDGVSVVALQLFIKSLRYRKITSDEIESGTLSPGETEIDVNNPPENCQIVATTPKLPALPELSQSDFYLLYSLMLHGDLTIRALAESLGDAPQIVNNQVQMLRLAGVIEQRDGVIKANPVYYPPLRRELSRNNFIIEVP
ncbi:MAG: helix-turn-helix domain-containing protein [Cyanobacteria bacterium P01_A01_bin.116]